MAFLLLIFLSTALLAAGPGYLPRIGPSPLRFQSPSPAPPAPVKLPPLVMSEPAPTPPAVKPEPPPLESSANPDREKPDLTANITGTNAVIPLSTGSPAKDVAASQPSRLLPELPTSQSSELISPGMLVRYFKSSAPANATNNPAIRSTNGVAKAIVLPVNFTPPPISTPPSSGAKYVSP